MIFTHAVNPRWLTRLITPALFLAAALAVSAESPTSVIDSLHRDLINVMKAAADLSFEQRAKALGPPVRAAFDFNLMAVKVLGPGAKTLTDADLSRWTETFTRFTIANYARRFTGYSGQVFETLGEESAPHDTRLVRTRLVRPHGDDFHIDYRMYDTPNGWKIIDVYANGTVSELALRRAELAPLLEREGLERLITTVDRHTAKQ